MQSLMSFLSRHRRHGYFDGPDYTPFKFDLDSAYRAVKDSQKKLSFLDVRLLEHHVLVTQRYEVLRRAAYESNGLTIGEAIEAARKSVLHVFEQYAEIYPPESMDWQILKLLSAATNAAADEVNVGYARMRNKPADRWQDAT